MNHRDPLREIEDALSFEVSGDFCARVRQQVALEPARSRKVFNPWLAVAALVVLMAGAGAVAALRQRARPIDVATVSSTRRPEPVATIEPVHSEAANAVPRIARARTVESAKPFDTLVPDDQLRALDRLLAGMRAGRATVPAQVSDVVVNDRGERVLRALALEPLIIEPLAGTPAEPNKNPGKDPNK